MPLRFCLFVLFLLLPTWSAQAQPVALEPGVSFQAVTQTTNTAVRLAYDPTDGALWYLTLTGELFRISPPYVGQNARLLYTSANHGLSNPSLGFIIAPDGTFYLVGDQVDDSVSVGTIRRGAMDGGQRVWTTVAQTERYPRSNTPFDHNFNGIALSPDGAFLYVNSGSRTEHGEVQANDGRFPGTREVPLTSAVFRLPADATDLVLPNDSVQLATAGYLFADGLRNSFDLAFNADGHLFGTENSGDRDDQEELNWIREGHHYGFPWRMGTNDTPQQFPGFDPDTDPLINPASNAYQNGFFYDDPSYPARPVGVSFTDPIVNTGPDAALFRDPADGTIKDAAALGQTVSTFTPHLSPLGLVFDTARALPAPYTGDGFVLSWTSAETSGLLNPFGDAGEDLLHLRLNPTADNYEVAVTRLAKGFRNPIDAVLVQDTLYVLEFGNDKTIWQVTFADDTATEALPSTAPAQLHVYPNPLRQQGTLHLQLATTEAVTVDVFDLLGRRLARLHDGLLPAQKLHRFVLDAVGWPAGVYFVRVQGQQVVTRPFVVQP